VRGAVQEAAEEKAMTIRLRAHGKSFATRQRARDIAALVNEDDHEFRFDVSDVVASPSFVAELLGLLCSPEHTVVVDGASEYMATLVERVSNQLKLEAYVRISQGAV
jgi:hypothetical protein